jgi:hypothetical protein
MWGNTHAHHLLPRWWMGAVMKGETTPMCVVFFRDGGWVLSCREIGETTPVRIIFFRDGE